MGEYIENKPMGCNVCGNYPIFGQENSTEVGDNVIIECRWICDRCSNVVRVDEKAVPKNVQK
jgi:hypothetical protein